MAIADRFEKLLRYVCEECFAVHLIKSGENPRCSRRNITGADFSVSFQISFEISPTILQKILALLLKSGYIFNSVQFLRMEVLPRGEDKLQFFIKTGGKYVEKEFIYSYLCNVCCLRRFRCSLGCAQQPPYAAHFDRYRQL
jgi:hypothetical protein